CVPAIFAAGITRVVAAAADANPFVSGGGAAALRDKGVAVVTGVLEGEAAAQNRVFFTAMREGRPHVTLKAGMTADGKIADVHGAARWITGEAARAEAHRQRSEVDAIVAGVTTVLRDDPALTVRLGRPWPREPWRVVLDTDARTPVRAQVIAAASPSRALVAGGAGRDLKSAIRLGQLTARAVGDDLLIEADVLRDANGSSPDSRGGGADVAADHGPPDRRGGGALRSRPGGT